MVDDVERSDRDLAGVGRLLQAGGDAGVEGVDDGVEPLGQSQIRFRHLVEKWAYNKYNEKRP